MTSYERFQKVPPRQKAAIGVLLAALIVGAYYALFYSSLLEEKAQLDQRNTALLEEKRNYENQKQEYLQIRSEIGRLLDRQKENQRILPQRDEIASLLDDIHAQADLSGLSVQSFEPKPEVPQQYHVKIPVGMSVTGTFHGLTKFFRNVGQQKRIVNVEDVAISTPKVEAKQVLVTGAFTAVAFRALDRAPVAPVAPGAQR